jgi:hypothetical protein
MLKSTFLDALHEEITTAAQQELGPLAIVTGCPYIETYFARYRHQPSATIESLLRRYAPACRDAVTAAGLIPAVVERVRTGVQAWVQTGQPPVDVAPFENGVTNHAGATPNGGLHVQAKAAAGAIAGAPDGSATLAQLGSGSPIDAATQSRIGTAMEDDFSAVRIHTDDRAGALARNMDALAFTVGSHVAFAPGQYAPGTPEGDALLAHELVHVQQQRGAVGDAQPKLESAASDAAAEDDADRGAASALGRLYGGVRAEAASLLGRAGSAMKTGLSLRRCKNEAKARVPAEKAEEYVLRCGKHDFVVSCELLPGQGAGQVRTIVQPVNWNRVFQGEKKYYDVRGREVDGDDSYTTMAHHSVPAAPFERTFTIPDRARFRGAFPVASGSGHGIDIDGDGKPDLDLQYKFDEDKIFTYYNFELTAGGKTFKFDYHYIVDNAAELGYNGNHVPRREPDDLLDILKATVDIGVGFIPVIGDIVDLAEAVTGYTKWGDKMTPAERAVTGLAVLIPFAGGAIARKATKTGLTLAEAAAKLGRTEDELIAALKAIENRSADHALIESFQAELKAGRKLADHQLQRLNQILHQVDAETRTFRAIEQSTGVEGVLRRGGKVAAETGPVSIKGLRNTLGRAGVSPSPYHLRKASAADLDALRAAGTVARSD